MTIESGIHPPLVSARAAAAATVCPADVSRSPHARLKTLSATKLRLKSGLWRQRIDTNRDVSLKHGHDMLESAGSLHNLALAAGRAQGEYHKRLATDSDVYKWLEAIAYTLAQKHDDTLEQMADAVITLIVEAQDDDGYLMSYFQVVEPDRRWGDLASGHELYCAGHLMQAAIAYDAATGDRRLLDVAERLVDHIAQRFGPDRLPGAPGHPGIEMALVEFYRYTARAEGLDLARFFLDQRGRVKFEGVEQWVFQNHAPIAEQTTLDGHAVRQMYLVAGVADRYLETGESHLIQTLEKQWGDMLAGKLFITGGVGQRHYREVFGDAYELSPDRCYCESCAAIGGIMWNWRMLLATGEARFANLIEQTLFNGFLGAGSLDGQHFFYVNPLMSRGQPRDVGDAGATPWRRKPWHQTACCPPNIMRLLASLPHYLTTTDDHGIQVQQYAPCTVNADSPASGVVHLEMDTRYPWDADVSIKVTPTQAGAWALSLRVPGWCKDFKLLVNDQPHGAACENGYIRLTRSWQPGDRIDLRLAMPTTLMVGDPRIDAVRGCAAIQRGPLLYCVEQCDCPEGVDMRDLTIADEPRFEAEWDPQLLGGAVAIGFDADLTHREAWRDSLYQPLNDRGYAGDSASIRLKAIPYFLWANREPGMMRLWIPRADCRTSGQPPMSL